MYVFDILYHLPSPTFLIFTFILVLCGYYYIVLGSLRKRHLPPGPRGLPFVGVVPFLGKNQFQTFAEWGERYGSIIQVPLGIIGKRLIVLNDADIIREAFTQDVFSDRPRNFRNETIAKNRGLVGTSGPKGRKQRQFALTTLKDFGMGRVAMETKIQEELQYLIQVITNKNGKPFDIRQILTTSVCNIIVSVIYGKRFSHSDPRLQGYIKSIDTIVGNLLPLNQIMARLPFLRHLPGDLFNFWKTIDAYKVFKDDIRNEIDKHKTTFQADMTRDYIDAYLHKMTNLSDNPTFTELQLMMSGVDMFLAGMETTSTTLRWAILYILLNPDVQEKVHREIDEQIGDAVVGMSHRAKVPYVDATIREIQRCSSITPGALPHTNREETYLRDYKIPKDSLIVANVWNVHHDPMLWEEPMKFNPDRFLKDGKVVKTNNLIPFSVGKRSCPGEALAKMELFIFFTGLMRHFRFEPEYEKVLPSAEPLYGSVLTPRPFSVRAVPRLGKP